MFDAPPPNSTHGSQPLVEIQPKKLALGERVGVVNEGKPPPIIPCPRRNQVVLLEAMRPDFDPAFDIVEQNLNRIGRLRRATFEFCQYSSRYDKFREGIVMNAFDPTLGNAAFMDIGVYCIHSLVRLFGMPQEIQAFSTKLSNDFDGSGIVLMKYETMIADAVYSKLYVSVNPSVIQGEVGSILIGYITNADKN